MAQQHPGFFSSKSRVSTEYADYSDDQSSPDISGYSSMRYVKSNPTANSYGSNYNARVFKPTHRRTIHFPKSVLTTNVPEIREFNEPQKHLYYFLTWSCKMALIDEGFIHFTFSNRRNPDIGVFNTELHHKRSNAVLFVVAKFTQINRNSKGAQPLWTMDTMLTARELYTVYGINECDLPNGSRSNRNYFQTQINAHYERLQSLVYVNDWSKIQILPNKKQFDENDVAGVDLNQAIQDSVEQIKDSENDLELIPILTIKGRVYCDVLIPIKVNSKWFAVTYRTSTIRPYKATVTGLCVDADDILNKASLVDPNAVTTYQWICDNPEPEIECLDDFKPPALRPRLADFKSSDSVNSVKSEIIDSVSNQSIRGLQQQLAAALQREKMLMSMMMHQTQLKSSRSSQSVSMTTKSSFMSLPAVSVGVASPSMPFIQTPSIPTMSECQSAPMLPIVHQNGASYASPMCTPPPFNLGGSHSFKTPPSMPPSMESSPSFGSVNIQAMANEFIHFQQN